MYRPPALRAGLAIMLLSLLGGCGVGWTVPHMVPLGPSAGLLLGLLGLVLALWREVALRARDDRVAAAERIERLNRILLTLSEVNDLTGRLSDRAELLERVCRVLVERSGFDLAWYGVPSPCGRLVPAAWHGDCAVYLQDLPIRWDDSELGRGPMGTAIRTGRPKVVPDVEADPDFRRWWARARRCGFRSVASFPVRGETAVLGGLAVYGRTPGPFDAETLRLMERLADNLGHALEALEAREALRQAEARMRTLSRAIEQSPSSVVITDVHGAIEYVNPAFTNLTGYSADEVAGRNPRLLQSGHTPPERYEDLWRTLTTGREWRGEFLNRTKDGRILCQEAVISPIQDPGGRVTHFVGVQKDVTERRRAEEELERARLRLLHAQKMDALGRLAGGVAHDFNNLLTGISGFGTLACEHLPEGSPGRSYLEEVLRASDRAADLTRQLLAFSRQQHLADRDLELNRTIEALARLLARIVGEVVEVELRLASEPVWVRMDPSQLEQVVVNLVVNARDAMPDGGRVVLAVGVDGEDRAVLEVQDEGCGMDEATLSRLFEPFFTTKPEGHGTGLGLATVFGIVEQTGGTVSVDSAPGRGSRFRVTLPRLDAPQMEAPEPPAAEARGGGESLLVVEDEDAVRNLLERVLNRAGYRVLSFQLPEDALRACEGGQRPQGLVTDVVMPGMSGPELARRVREHLPRLPVVFLSGYSPQKLTLDHRSRFLPKPFTPDGLTRTVRQALDEPL